jgi:hypothetical protein
MSDEQTLSLFDLERMAQRAAEQRMHDAWASLEIDIDDEALPVELAGAYCGCLTCDVREVLDAAWPYLYRMAIDPSTDPPALPSE